jgi:hypothetical protein
VTCWKQNNKKLDELASLHQAIESLVQSKKRDDWSMDLHTPIDMITKCFSRSQRRLRCILLQRIPLTSTQLYRVWWIKLILHRFWCSTFHQIELVALPNVKQPSLSCRHLEKFWTIFFKCGGTNTQITRHTGPTAIKLFRKSGVVSNLVATTF